MLRTFFYDHPHYHVNYFPLQQLVAYFFTYTMVSAQFLRNVPILNVLRQLLTYFCILLSRLDALYM